MAEKKSVLNLEINPTKAKQGAEEALKSYKKFYDYVNSTIDRIRKAFDRMTSSMASSMASSVNSIKSTWSALNSYIVTTFRATTEKVRSGWASVKDFMVNKFAPGISKVLNTLFGKTISHLKIVISYLGPLGLLGAINKIIASGIKIQKFTVAFSVITGSIKEAKNELQYMIDYANKLGLAFDAAAAPFAKFFAAARNALTADKIREIYEAFAQVSVALHLAKQEVTGVFLALQQIASKGRVSMEELRLQLAERVPGAMRLAAESMNMSMRDFEQAVRKGTIDAGEFLSNFANKLSQEFGPAAERASNLAQASINKFTTSTLLALNRIAESGVLQSVTNLLDTVRVKLLDNGNYAEILGGAITKVVDKVNEYVKNISSKDALDALTFMANVFVNIYNTVIDLIPQIQTIVNVGGAIGSLISSISEYFDEEARARKKRIKELKEEIKFIEDSLPKMAQDFGIIGKDGSIDTTTEAFKAWSEAIRIAQERLADLKSELASYKEEIEGPEKLKPFKPSDFSSNAVGSSENLSDEYSPQAKLDAIQDRIRSSYDLVDELEKSLAMHKTKIELVQADMLEAEARMNELRAKAASSSLDLNYRLQASRKLSKAVEDYLELRAEFEELSYNALQKEITNLNRFVEGMYSGLINYLSFSNELFAEDLARKSELLDRAVELDLISRERAYEMREALELQHQARMGDIIAKSKLKIKELEQKSLLERANIAANELDKMTSVGSKTSKKLFELNKKAKLASAYLELPSAMSSAYAYGSSLGGPILGSVFAGVAFANQMALIQQIKATKFGGGGSSSPPQSSSIPTVDPIPPQSDALFNRTNEGQSQKTVDSTSPDSPINVSFTINAIDAKGVDQILMSRKSTITGIIQSAYTERGRRGGPIT